MPVTKRNSRTFNMWPSGGGVLYGKPEFHMACPKSRVNQKRPHEMGLTRCCKLARPRIYFNREKPNLSCMVCFTRCSQVSSLTCKKKQKNTNKINILYCFWFIHVLYQEGSRHISLIQSVQHEINATGRGSMAWHDHQWGRL